MISLIIKELMKKMSGIFKLIVWLFFSIFAYKNIICQNTNNFQKNYMMKMTK